MVEVDSVCCEVVAVVNGREYRREDASRSEWCRVVAANITVEGSVSRVGWARSLRAKCWVNASLADAFSETLCAPRR